mgnify:CR=1 FL=1
MRLWPVLLLGASLLAACTAREPVQIQSEERIGSIETRPNTPVQEAEISAPDTGEALAQYEALLREETDPGKRAQLAQRAAELRLQLAAEQGPVKSGSPSTRGTDQSIQLLEASLSPAAGEAGNDQILYQLARAYDLAGQPKKSQLALTRLINEHPRSGYYDEALFRRGERHFINAQYRQAEADYAALLGRQGNSAFVAPARHKLAWAIFKQGRYRETLHKLLPLLDQQLGPERLSADGASLNLKSMDAAARERLQDSVRVAVLSYALLGGESHIPASLRGHPQHYRALLYMQLANLYEERGHPEQAGRILRDFIGRYPDDPAITVARHRMITLLDQSGDQQEALLARANFVSSQLGSQDPQTRELLDRDLDYLTRYYHARAQATAPAQNRPYREALRWYSQLLDAFPERHDKRYLMAELMLDHGEHLQAAPHFEKLGYETPGFDKAREAAYAALLARRKAGQGAAEAGLRFANAYPDHKETTTILVAAAESRYAQQEYAQAIKQAETLLHGQLPLEQRLAMLSLVAHAHFELNDYAASEQAARDWLDMATQRHADQPVLQSLLANSVYRQAQAAREAGDPQTVQQLLRLRSLAPANLDNPAGRLRASASLQAAQLQLNSEQWSAAAHTLEELQRAFPKHPKQAEIARGLALTYEKQGQQEKAAAAYARFGQATDDPELRRAAAFQAAELHYQAGRLGPAAEAFTAYCQAHPRPLQDHLQAQNRLVDIYTRLNDSRRLEWLRKIVQTDASAGSQRSDVSRSLAANAALQLADAEAAAYHRSALRPPLDQSIVKKQTALETALNAYSKAADYAVAETTTAASYQIAELYRDFAASLLKAPPPGNLSAAERDEMQVLLEEQAFPLEAKAIQIHETNVARLQQGLHDPWIGKSLLALMELVPGRYAKREQSDPGASAASGDEETLLTQARNAHGDLQAWLNLGMFYAGRDNPARTEWALKHATTLSPGQVAALNELGIAQRKLQRLAEAEQSYKQALTVRPDYAPAHRNLGILYDLYLGRKQEALKHYRRYADLQPDNEAAKLWIAELEQQAS